MNELVKQDDGRNAGVKKQNPKKVFEKNEHACYMLGGFEVSDPTAHPKKRINSRPYTHGLEMATLLQWTSLVKIGKIFSGSWIGFEV